MIKFMGMFLAGLVAISHAFRTLSWSISDWEGFLTGSDFLDFTDPKSNPGGDTISPERGAKTLGWSNSSKDMEMKVIELEICAVD